MLPGAQLTGAAIALGRDLSGVDRKMFKRDSCEALQLPCGICHRVVTEQRRRSQNPGASPGQIAVPIRPRARPTFDIEAVWVYSGRCMGKEAIKERYAGGVSAYRGVSEHGDATS